jgi:hypothetical protein
MLVFSTVLYGFVYKRAADIFESDAVYMFMIFVFFIAYVGIVHINIRVDACGVEYHRLSYRLYTPWNNIDSIHSTDERLLEIVLKAPTKLNSKIIEGRSEGIAVIERNRAFWWMRPAKWLLKQQAQSISLAMMGISIKDWERGTLRHEFEQYAPEVVEKMRKA